MKCNGRLAVCRPCSGTVVVKCIKADRQMLNCCVEQQCVRSEAGGAQLDFLVGADLSSAHCAVWVCWTAVYAGFGTVSSGTY